jgi:endonuclease/exonuclease/phosphatase family metal-dependent hydrolase
MKFRLCSFNIENLFTRPDFSAFTDDRAVGYLPSAVQFLGQFGTGDLSTFDEFKRVLQTATIAQEDDRRQQTALAMRAADAHVYCLQEVDSFDAMARFLDAYAKKTMGETFHNRVLHEGNDMRGIDVAAISEKKFPFYSRSHAALTGSTIDDTDTGQALLEEFPIARTRANSLKSQRLFRRDCLELEFPIGDERLTVLNCHFKSMGGRDAEKSLGTRQAEAIMAREIITRKFEDPATGLWAIVGDLNDAEGFRFVSKVENSDGSFNETQKDQNASGFDTAGVTPILFDDFGVNLLNALSEEDRWTHFYSSGRHKTQLDYIITSPALATRLRGTPEVIRAGMPYRVPNLDVSRYPRIGWDRPKASDHCPVVAEFDI